MRLKYFTLALFLLSFSSSQASYFESCRVWAEVVSRTNETHFVVKVKRVSMKEGSHGKSHCEALRAGPVQVLLTEGKLPNKDKDIVLEYSYHDGITPEGVVFTKRWKLPTKK